MSDGKTAGRLVALEPKNSREARIEIQEGPAGDVVGIRFTGSTSAEDLLLLAGITTRIKDGGLNAGFIMSRALFERMIETYRLLDTELPV